jgi:hypothetical protein
MQENENLQDQYKQLVQQAEQIEDVQPEPLNLGKVDMNRFATQTAQDADVILGYYNIELENLPSGGKFYPADATISIRSAKVGEIRHFSTVDEGNLIDIEEKLNYIIKSCIRFVSKSKVYSYKDILEEDRIFLLLSIRDLTFPEPELKLTVKAKTKDGEEFDAEIASRYFQLSRVPEDIEKYYDDQTRAYEIQTRSFGTITMRPPTIGVMEQVTDYIRVRQIEKKPWDQSYLQILPYIQKDWRGFNEASIFKGEVAFNSWNEKKYMLVYRLAEKMKIGVQPEMLVQHEDEEVLVPITFRDGIKSLFIVQDIAGELL